MAILDQLVFFNRELWLVLFREKKHWSIPFLLFYPNYYVHIDPIPTLNINLIHIYCIYITWLVYLINYILYIYIYACVCLVFTVLSFWSPGLLTKKEAPPSQVPWTSPTLWLWSSTNASGSWWQLMVGEFRMTSPYTGMIRYIYNI